jgi:choloylglycine hydrolase
MSKAIRVLCAAMLLLSFVPGADACTSIRIKTTDGLVFYARTLEGQSYGSTISIIPKGTQYVGTLPDGKQDGMKWTTKYGMVGMNVMGLPMLIDGINEKGLVVGNLMFPVYAEYQPFDPKETSKTIANWEAATWILSNFATVDEVKQGIKDIRVCEVAKKPFGKLELHFVVHDPAGNCLVVEYVKGKLTTYDNPLGVMTNSPPFDWQLINLSNHINMSATNVKPLEIDDLKVAGIGQGTGMLGLPGDYTPPSRFVRMVALVTSSLPVTGPDAGLSLVMTLINNIDIAKGTIRQPYDKGVFYDITNWTVVADVARGRYYFRTYDNKDWQYIDVKKALVAAKGIMSVPIDTPPEYKDITADAKEIGKLPADMFPAGKP